MQPAVSGHARARACSMRTSVVARRAARTVASRTAARSVPPAVVRRRRAAWCGGQDGEATGDWSGAHGRAGAGDGNGDGPAEMGAAREADRGERRAFVGGGGGTGGGGRRHGDGGGLEAGEADGVRGDAASLPLSLPHSSLPGPAASDDVRGNAACEAREVRRGGAAG